MRPSRRDKMKWGGQKKTEALCHSCSYPQRMCMIYNRSFSSPFIQSNTYVHSGFIPMSHSFLFFVCFSWTFVPKALLLKKKIICSLNLSFRIRNQPWQIHFLFDLEICQSKSYFGSNPAWILLSLYAHLPHAHLLTYGFPIISIKMYSIMLYIKACKCMTIIQPK